MNIINQEHYLNYNIIEYDVVDSTMIVVKNFSENTIIISKKQNNGKGKGDRVWTSESSNNLYCSINIKANKKNLDYSQISFLTSLAIRQTIEKQNKIESNKIVSKWPNDILINNKKVSGILLEFDNLKNNLIIGIGINIDNFPENTFFKTTSLKQENIIVEKYELLKDFLNNFNFLFKEWENSGFLTIREKWLKSSYKFKEKIEVNGKIGIFEDISSDGTLIVLLDNGKKYLVKSGDVF